MFSISYFLELVLYSLINMAPYILIVMYIFHERFRFSLPVTWTLAFAVFAVQVFSRWYGTAVDTVPYYITSARFLSYAAFYLFTIKAHWGKKLFVLLVTFNISSFISIGAHFIENLITPLDTHHSYCLHASLSMLVLHLLITLPFAVMVLRFAKPLFLTEPYGKEWCYYFLVPATFTGLWFYYIYGTSMNAQDLVATPKTIIFLLLIQLSGMLMYYLVLKLSSQMQENLNLERENHLLDVEKIEYQSLCDKIEETRRSRHDLRHHILVMLNYVENQEYDSLKEYLNEYQQSIPDTTNYLFCNHRFLNRLFLFFAIQARENDIDFQATLNIPSDLPIPDSELAVLFGNLLENALDACKEQIRLQRNIIVYAKADKHSFSFTIDNTCENTIKKKNNGDFLTTKKKGSGIGIKSAQNIANKYNGVFSAEQKENMFYVSVMLNL